MHSIATINAFLLSQTPTHCNRLQFMGALKPKPEDGSGDVKYHLGLSVTRPTTSGKQVCCFRKLLCVVS